MYHRRILIPYTICSISSWVEVVQHPLQQRSYWLSFATCKCHRSFTHPSNHLIRIPPFRQLTLLLLDPLIPSPPDFARVPHHPVLVCHHVIASVHEKVSIAAFRHIKNSPTRTRSTTLQQCSGLRLQCNGSDSFDALLVGPSVSCSVWRRWQTR